MSRVRLLLFVVLVGLLAACKPAADGDAASMTMRVYPVPAERAQSLVDSLNHALAAGTDRAAGTAALGGEGQVIVLAPDSLHPSVATSLQDIVAAAAPEATKVLPQLRLRFWSIDAVPGEGTDSSGLDALAPALDELRAGGGSMHFVLRDHVDSVSTLDERIGRSWASDIAPHSQALQYMIRRRGTQHVLELDISDLRSGDRGHGSDASNLTPQRTNTVTTLEPGQTLVIASQPITGADDTMLSRYYIVRIDDLGAG